MKLKEITGSFFIESTVSDMKLVLDGISLGRLENGLFKDITIGTHKIELKNVNIGYYWEDEIEVVPNKTTRIYAEPYGIGNFSYSIPKDINVEIYGENLKRRSLAGEGSLLLREGIFFLKASGDNYLTDTSEIKIGRADEINYIPKLEYSEEFKKSLKARRETMEEEDAYNSLAGKLNNLSVRPEGPEKIEVAEDLLLEIISSGYDFPSLREYGKELLKEFLKHRIDTLRALIDESEEKATSKSTISTISFITAAAGIVVGGIFTTLGIFEYDTYQNAVTTPTAEASRNKLSIYAIAQYAGYGIGGAGGIFGLVLSGKDNNLEVYQTELAQRSNQLAKLNGGL